MDSVINWFADNAIAVYLIVAGLVLAGVALPRWVCVVAGICGLLAGLFLLI